MKIVCLGGCAALLAACSSTPSRAPAPSQPQPPVAARPGGEPPVLAQQPSNNPCVYARAGNGAFYKDDGPLDLPPWIDLVPEATPRAEPLHRFANNPYTVLGQSFTPLRQAGEYRAQGVGSWYGRKFHGQKTSSGEVYDMFAMTAASPVLPIPSYARVTNVKNGRSVIVRVNDRGPFHKGRVIDLSFVAACRLGYAMQGSSEVVVESLAANGAPPPANVATQVETTAPVAAPLPAPIADSGGGVYLQLGAFSSRTNAEAFHARLAGELPPGSPLVIQTAGTVHRVRLGPYPDRRAAELAARQLADAHDLTAVIGR
ncbi:septal ring lytic transglycosylase RlpA family protein [Chitiniphilus shinanonensis]|uniref:septal ring lytic transglycosylase RlpA family protein n=1 Tax=Chitiniphilus shinanonensis TaxID=553088 RepID=UPI000366D984|nr:septal ring lytic transglycosylase RlpA family protein [Chitiniphilus shinanonensis]